MEKKPLFVFTVLLQAFVLRSCLGVLVRFPKQQPVYIVSGTDLLLQAQIEQLPGDHTKRVTWQHQQKQNSEKKTVAEYPAKTSRSRVTLEKDGTVLKLLNYQSSDSGIYTITVTNQKGGQVSAQCTVLEYEAVHHVSVMVNVSHTSLHCREAWGTDPVFSWLHEKTAVTEQVGTVSPDGSSLYLSMPLCGHFTCLVSNKLGHSSATYTAEPCEKTRSATAIAVVCLTLLLLLAGGLAFMLWRRHRDHSSRGERLQESFEDVV